jgi:hypothetical protein
MTLSGPTLKNDFLISKKYIGFILENEVEKVKVDIV